MSLRSRILLAGDIHSKVDNVYRLAMALQTKKLMPNLVILTGDLINANHDYQSPSSPSSSSVSSQLTRMRTTAEETQFRAVLTAFGSISRNVMYVPGNHDPREAFPDLVPAVDLGVRDEGRERRDNGEEALKHAPLWQRMMYETGAVNFHSRLVRLAPNLVMAGLGGSVPQTDYNRPNTTIHPGYPYTDPLLKTALLNLLRAKRHFLTLHPAFNIIAKSHRRADTSPSSLPSAPTTPTDPDTHILITHCGPARCATTDTYPKPWLCDSKRIESGSDGVRSVVTHMWCQGVQPPPPSSTSQITTPTGDTQQQPPLLFHAHGHAHTSWGLSQLGNVPVINPGALRDGRYAVVTVERSWGEEGRVWRVEDVRFGCVR
ncbi:uncharacterized protein EV422DRAFT_564064 [Fimicolochytrium jonesii]|uniref:uncharacterized protein n=1 Tax=Fimicolochytrium jonesii TaxID=1396493 RepID=UPI0022FE0668|nr:uncharacterized protein EV422DRAFT_564064 [Fimicolochytrium jonesii]KAI8826254.1 hypothetical protein EV422DRAFT_564064 [Fimicolochytrium jonesii]